MANYVLNKGKWEVEKNKKIVAEKTETKKENKKSSNLLQKIGGTTARALTSVGKGFLQGTEGIGDFIQYRGADLAGALGNKGLKEQLISSAKQDTTGMLTGKAEKTYDPYTIKPFQTGQIGDVIGQGVGQVGSMIGGSGLLKGASTINAGKFALPTSALVQGVGSGTTQALNKGAKYDKAKLYGLGSGLINAGSEALSGGIGGVFGKGAIDDVVVNSLTNKVKSNLGKNLTKIGIKSIGEGLEENISGVLDPILQRLTIDQKAKLYSGDQALQDFVIGATTSAILQSPSITSKQPIITKNKVQEQTNVRDNVITPTNVETSSQVAEISSQNQIKPLMANTQNNLPSNVESQISPILGQKESKLQKSIQKSPIISKDFKDNTQPLTYDPISNQETMDEAKSRLDKDLNNEVVRLFNIDPTKATATDVAGLIQLQNEYQSQGNLRSFQETVNKLRQIGTSVGQATQAFAILQRMTPEGMVYYAQKDLQDIFDTVSKSKNQQWVDKNKEKFNLTDQEMKNIMDKMQQVAQTTDVRQKKILLAQIQKIVNNKIPSSLGNEIKSFRRISMLFNPKTQIRNITGNIGILPLNVASDFIGSQIDKGVSKITGYRTIAPYQAKQYGSGFKKGVSEVVQDYKLGIDTNNIDETKFEIGRGKSFNDNTLIGKALNKVDRLNSTMLKLGDNPFFEAEFNNSLKNQMKINNVIEPTQDMIDIATETALERTWQDNNEYTKAVLSIRNAMNKLNYKGFGLGDVIVPFAKTPANITKAMIDYSPIGLVKSLTTDAIKFKNAISKGEATPQMQRKFVNNLSKGISGSLLYLIAFGLKDSLSGKADEDKDVRDFMKNTLGISPYSVKIGDKSYTYDWIQPVATPFSIIADTKDTDKTGLQKVITSLGTAGDRLIEQSFLQGINNLFSNLGSGEMENVFKTLVQDLPPSFVPTLSKQIADATDKNARLVYSNNLSDTVKKSILVKTPELSKKLDKKYDSLGKEVLKYGGDNNLFNVFINPSNVNKSKNTEVGKEILKIYDKTDDKTIFPRVAPYSIKIDGETKNLTTKQQSQFQKISGDIVNEQVKKLLNNNSYNKLSVEKKAEILNSIVGYAYNKAKSEVFNVDISKTYKTADNSVSKKYSLTDFYLYNIKNKKD